jgi:hypothetical protein
MQNSSLRGFIQELIIIIGAFGGGTGLKSNAFDGGTIRKWFPLG